MVLKIYLKSKKLQWRWRWRRRWSSSGNARETEETRRFFSGITSGIKAVTVLLHQQLLQRSNERINRSFGLHTPSVYIVYSIHWTQSAHPLHLRTSHLYFETLTRSNVDFDQGLAGRAALSPRLWFHEILMDRKVME